MSEAEKSAPVQAPAPTSAPTGKKNNTTLIVIILVVLVVLGGIGYAAQRYFAKKVAEKIVEGTFEAATGSKVDVNSNGDGVTLKNDSGTVSTGSSAKWPTTMPAEVPEFKYGTIAYSSSSKTADYTGWIVTYSDITADNANAYFATLTSAGWAQTSSVDMGTLINRTFDKGTLQINLMLDTDSKGLTFTVNYK